MTGSSWTPGAFLRELKRRRVFRVAAVYAAVGWVLVEVTATIFPGLGLPDWTVTFVIVLVLLGFPIALLLGWAFELTPEGMRLDPGGGERRGVLGDPGEPDGPAEVGGRRIPARVRAGVLVALAAGGAAALLLLADEPGGESEEETLAPLPPVDASVAVLPFANLSGDAANDPFVSGVHGDLLSRLARIEGIRPISRTSVLTYRNTTKRLPTIAEELGVSTILEGDVQRVGERVRINVKLVEGATDRPLWAESYNRELTVANVFDIQGEIAARIAGALRTTLTADEEREIRAPPTTDLAAYDAYQGGVRLIEDARDEESVLAAVEMFRRAVEADAAFGIAWALLAQYENFLAWAHDLPRRRRPAERALERAVALAPEAPETLRARGFLLYHGPREYDRALTHFREAVRRRPNDAELIQLPAFILRRQNRWEEAAATWEEAFALDPRNYLLALDLASSYARLWRMDEARRLIDRAISLSPDLPRAYGMRLGLELAEHGDTASARRMVEELPGTLAPETRRRLAAALAYYQEDLRALDTLLSPFAVPDTPESPTGVRLHLDVTVAGVPLLRSQILGIVALRTGRPELARVYGDSARTVAARAVADAEALGGFASVNARTRAHWVAAIASALVGDSEATRGHLSRAEALVPAETDALFGDGTRRAAAVAYALLGETTAALETLEELLPAPSSLTPALLRIDPAFAPLRKKPRFLLLAATRDGDIR